MLLFVPPDRHAAVKEKLSNMIHVPFKFEFEGSQIIFYEPGEDYSEVEAERKRQEILPFRELSLVA